MLRRTLGMLLLCSLGLVFACDDEESCDDGFTDHCDGATAVTCKHRYSTGSGFQLGGDPVSRVACASGVCGRSCYCTKECDICEAKLVMSVSCDPDPASCDATCSS